MSAAKPKAPKSSAFVDPGDRFKKSYKDELKAIADPGDRKKRIEEINKSREEFVLKLSKKQEGKKKGKGGDPKWMLQDEQNNCTYEPSFPPKGFLDQLFKRDPKRQPVRKIKTEGGKKAEPKVPKHKGAADDDWEHQDKHGRYKTLMTRIGQWDGEWQKTLKAKSEAPKLPWSFQPDLKIGEKELASKAPPKDDKKAKSSAAPTEEKKEEKKWEPFLDRLNKSLAVREERIAKLNAEVAQQFSYKPVVTEWPPKVDEKEKTGKGAGAPADGAPAPEASPARTIQGTFDERLRKDIEQRKTAREPPLDEKVYTFKPVLMKPPTEPGNINDFLGRLSKDLQDREDLERKHITDLLAKPTLSPPKRYPRPKAMDASKGASSKKSKKSA